MLEERRVEPAHEVGLERTSCPDLLRLDREHRLAADGREVGGVHTRRSPERRAHVVDRRGARRPGANLEPAAEIVDVDGMHE